MSKRSLTIVQLYARDMNIYGDNGNVLVLQRRLERRGYDVTVVRYNPGDSFPKDVDIIVGGGGQDSGQGKIHADLLQLGPTLTALADNNVPMLVVCGLYQLFGHFFKTVDGETLDGISLLDVTTFGTSERLIGNIVTESSEFGILVGYENHSGQTTLGPKAQPLATVRTGAGNDLQSGREGARYKNVIGTYMHGSLLPKNPAVADFLIRTAAINKYGDFDETPLTDPYVDAARDVAIKRPR